MSKFIPAETERRFAKALNVNNYRDSMRDPHGVSVIHKIANGDSSWDYYYSPKYHSVHYISKPLTGAASGYFSDLNYFYDFINSQPYLKRTLTKYGRHLFRTTFKTCKL